MVAGQGSHGQRRGRAQHTFFPGLDYKTTVQRRVGCSHIRAARAAASTL